MRVRMCMCVHVCHGVAWHGNVSSYACMNGGAGPY